MRALLGEYNKSLKDVIAIMDPQAGAKAGRPPATSARPTRKARAVKLYKNPHSGEVVETKGGNPKTLKEWKANLRLRDRGVLAVLGSTPSRKALAITGVALAGITTSLA